eukprot:1990940-Ditylum_brightwellii.AAC.1
MLMLIDGLKHCASVVVIGVTNCPNATDPALHCVGCFDCEIDISVPYDNGCLKSFCTCTCNMKLDEDTDPEKIDNEIHCFAGSDIAVLCTGAAKQCIFQKIANQCQDFGLDG